MKYTLGQAAIVAGKSKGTISNAIKNGRISAEKNDDGSYSIDASELHRVFPMKNLNSLENRQNERSETHDNPVILQARIHLLEQRLADLEKDREQNRLQLDRMHELYKDTVRLLEAPRTKGWLARLLGA